MSIGKKRKLVEAPLYVNASRDTERHRAGGVNAADIPRINTRQKDPIRYFTGKLWDYDIAWGHGQLLTFGNDTPWGDVFSIDYDEDRFFDGDLITEEQLDTKLFPTTTQVITIKPNLLNDDLWVLRPMGSLGQDANYYEKTFNEDLWNGILDTLLSKTRDQQFQDCPFEYYSPFETEEIEKLTVDNSPTLMADIDPQYNYFVGGYENRSRIAHESMLPCMYSFISERESDYLDWHGPDEGGSPYNKHISLMGRIAGVYRDIMRGGKKVGERSSGFVDYFQTWGKFFKRINRNPLNYAEIKNKYRNAFFSQVDVDFLKGLSSKKHMFPMYMDLKFSTGGEIEFARTLRDTELSADLFNHILNPPLLKSPSPGRFFGTREVIEGDNFELGNINSEYNIWDLTEWWGAIGRERDASNNVIFGRNKSNETIILNSCRPQISNLLKVVLAGRLREMVGEHNRGLKEIFEEGKQAYSETVFYKIDKTRKGRTEILQSFFVPNSDELGICNFIDTQVKYNVGYKYTISAYRLVYGTSYRYELITRGTGEVPHGMVEPHVVGESGQLIDVRHGLPDAQYYSTPQYKVIMEPYLKLVKVPYYKTRFEKILDKPPVAPDVNIIPFKDVDDKILFNLNANVGNYMLLPEIIEPGEQALVTQMERNQKVSPGSPINYASDDPPRFFEVYRLKEKPQSYGDFSGKLWSTVSTKYGKGNLFASSYVDRIAPNVKYYYVFRSSDIHQNLSYPSPVYEVEMVNADGAIYLVIDIVELKKETSKVPTKTMNKRIRISPSFVHQVVNQEETFARRRSQAEKAGLDASGISTSSARDLGTSHVVLGVAEEGIWNKKFKFRFISKNTGKKFDLNVKFEHVFDYYRGREDEEGNS